VTSCARVGDAILLRVLRNEFAHSRIPFGFRTPEIRKVCDEFKVVDLPGSTIPHGYLSRAPGEGLKAASDITDPKTRFISTCHSISYRMLVAKDGPREGDPVFPNNDPLP
jgi:hypothetical protein